MQYMRAVIQRSRQASVTVDQRLVGSIEHGLVVLLGVAAEDTPADADYLLEKILGLRIFDDAEGKMNLGLAQVGGELLIVSQFTLLGDARKGRRPSFIKAAGPELGRSMYEYFIGRAKEQGGRVATGEFGADMQVALINDGPVTILLDSQKLF
jgi:D-aminoacyl-tRNA deacylase